MKSKIDVHVRRDHLYGCRHVHRVRANVQEPKWSYRYCKTKNNNLNDSWLIVDDSLNRDTAVHIPRDRGKPCFSNYKLLTPPFAWLFSTVILSKYLKINIWDFFFSRQTNDHLIRPTIIKDKKTNLVENPSFPLFLERLEVRFWLVRRDPSNRLAVFVCIGVFTVILVASWNNTLEGETFGSHWKAIFDKEKLSEF